MHKDILQILVDFRKKKLIESSTKSVLVNVTDRQEDVSYYIFRKQQELKTLDKSQWEKLMLDNNLELESVNVRLYSDKGAGIGVNNRCYVYYFRSGYIERIPGPVDSELSVRPQKRQ